jgi:hypothetical protein
MSDSPLGRRHLHSQRESRRRPRHSPRLRPSGNFLRDSETRAHSRSSATRIAEVENAGKSDEKEKTPGNDGGFLWAMETWWRLDERDGGVYVQSEVASLTRDIPTGLGWLIGPFVNSIPKETLTFTLEATRKAVQSKLPKS